jgi:hypothetical protein
VKWISVKERLPASGSVALCGNFANQPKFQRQQFVAIYGSKRGWHQWFDDDDIRVAVTHWMPLPDPPTE